MKVEMSQNQDGDIVITDPSFKWVIICKEGVFHVFELYDGAEAQLYAIADSLAEAYTYVEELT